MTDNSGGLSCILDGYTPVSLEEIKKEESRLMEQELGGPLESEKYSGSTASSGMYYTRVEIVKTNDEPSTPSQGTTAPDLSNEDCECLTCSEHQSLWNKYALMQATPQLPQNADAVIGHIPLTDLESGNNHLINDQGITPPDWSNKDCECLKCSERQSLWKLSASIQAMPQLPQNADAIVGHIPLSDLESGNNRITVTNFSLMEGNESEGQDSNTNDSSLTSESGYGYKSYGNITFI